MKSEKLNEQLMYGVTPRFYYNAISDYIEVENPEEWLKCPVCGVKPLVWVYDNGRSTACKCGKNMYDHFSIYAESIMSFIVRNNGSTLNYDHYELMKNWNHWCKAKEILFIPNSERW